MKPKTEELLYYLLWFAESLSRPTYRNLDASFECWAYQNGFSRRLDELEKQQFIESKRSKATRRIYRLTEKGRLHTLGGQDPESRWNRSWDGKWRVILFDLPRSESTARKRLHKRFRAEGFGVLQNSVWISPDTLPEDLRELCGKGDDLSTMISMEGCPCAGEKHSRVVRQAWNFDDINQHYRAHREILDALPATKTVTTRQLDQIRKWAERERTSWLQAMHLDPLLPTTLLPSNYLGRKVWRRRQRVLAKAARIILGWKIK